MRARLASAVHSHCIALAKPPARLYVASVEGGDDRAGRVTASGAYTAPAVPPVPNIVTLTAVSVDNPNINASSDLLPESESSRNVTPAPSRVGWRNDEEEQVHRGADRRCVEAGRVGGEGRR